MRMTFTGMRRDGERRASALILLAGALLAATPASAQIFGRIKSRLEKVSEATKPMTVEEEKAIGREVASKIVAFYHLYPNKELNRYVNLVGRAVAARAERKDIEYHFAVLDSDSINAISAPGGYTFITRGALTLCKNESELAGVLAHEVGHVAGRHIMKIIERDKMMRSGLDEAARVPGSAYLQKVSKNILMKLLDQGLAPGDEFDADERGIRYAYAGGYPADGLKRFLESLDAITDQTRSFWSRTHPSVQERNQRITEEISKNGWSESGRPKLEDRYAQRVQIPLKPKGGA